jgi:PAS domain S-box-containing protein
MAAKAGTQLGQALADQEMVWSTAHWGDAESTLPELDGALMQLLLENIHTRVAVVDRERRYTYANRETLRFMGLTQDQVIGRHMSEVLDAGVYAGLVPLFDRAFAGESLHRRGWVDYARQGRRFREQWYVPYRPRGAADGTVQAVVVCGLDLTELRLGEQELARKQAQLRTSEALKSAIFDHALAALVSTDAMGRIVEFNPSAEAMFGHVRADVIGRPVSEVIVPPRYREAHEQGMRRMAEGGPARVVGKRLEMHALRADGSEFPMEMVLGRTDAEGTVFYTASIADLSERFEAARQIERQREALRQGEKLTVMGSLLAGVAHELNNPLAIVMGRASLLEDKCEDLPELRQDAKRMREAAERCGRIVQTFLNMARSRPAARGPVALSGIARAAAEMLQYGYRSHGVALELLLDEALPDVNADGDQIGQVVMNLLVNAQQALAGVPGERRVRVQTGLEPRRANREPRVWLRVEDNGGGVPAEARDRVFEPFFTTKAEGMGTGLGLAVSRSIAREHGGELTLEPTSTQGGASFRLSLPISGMAEADTVPSALPPTDTPTHARVLVVDDEAELADLIREMLEGAGYEVATAESGAVALALLAEARFDAVVSDLRMPDMDGAELWREISAQAPSLGRRVLFVTGDTLSPGAAEFLRQSRCPALDKPFSKAALLASVAELLG